MKVFFSAFFMAVAVNANAQQISLDTIYYDKDWKGVSHKAFATYYRVAEVNPTKTSKAFRDYYITGEIQSEGNYISIDRNDDSNSVFDGKWTTYYKSGKVEQTGYRKNGVAEGDYTVYYENGLVKSHDYLINGKSNGILTRFNEEGNVCIQTEMVNGEPKYDYYVMSNKDGFISKFSIKDDKQIWESPNLSEIKSEYHDGKPWLFYNKNGLVVAMTNSQIKDYGKWYRISVVIANNSLAPVEFDPANIKANIKKDLKSEKMSLVVYSADKFIKKVKKRQNLNLALAALGEGLAASGAGYSASTSKTNTTYSGNASAYTNAFAHSPRGYAYGHSDTYGVLNGSASTTTNTISYDGAAAYQAQVIASNRIADYQSSLLQERAIREEGYLKRTTIYPGETISGYVNIKRVRGGQMNVILTINNARYEYEWLLGNEWGKSGTINTVYNTTANSEANPSVKLDNIPPLPCKAVIKDHLGNSLSVVVISANSDNVIYKATNKNGKSKGASLSIPTNKIKAIEFE